MKKFKGFDQNQIVSIGDKYLTMDNTENISTIKIFKVDDILEIAPQENVYECTLIKYAYCDGHYKNVYSKN